MTSTYETSSVSPTTLTKINPLPRCLYPQEITYAASDFQRGDASPDSFFYVSPRLVQHIDEGAIGALKDYYGETIKVGDRVLDLCSSWTSHLPDPLQPERPRAGKGEDLKMGMESCIGYGMNEQEMARNEWLTEWVVRDLNVPPGRKDGDEEEGEKLLRELPDESIDVAICNVSIDYLIYPTQVMEEVKRVLRDGGTAHMAFSNRCFPTKVIGRWLRMGDDERRRWVGGYFWKADGFHEVEEVILKDGRDGWDPLYVVRARKAKGTHE